MRTTRGTAQGPALSGSPRDLRLSPPRIALATVEKVSRSVDKEVSDVPTTRVVTFRDPVSGRWISRIAGGTARFGAADLKSDAIAVGRAHAIRLGAEHVVENEDGSIARRTDYPRRSA